MMLTPEEQHNHRLQNAYCGILGAMDDPMSYTVQTDRYDIWRWDGEEFNRQYVALSFEESRSKLDDIQDGDQLAMLVPHVAVEHAAWFFYCIGKAGLSSCEHMKQAEGLAKLRAKQASQRKAKAK